MHDAIASVDKLISLAPPPVEMVDRVNPDDWPKIERELGTPLPEDYKLILTVYGRGDFNDLFYLFNPSAQADGMNLLKQARKHVEDYDSHLECYEEAKREYPEECPFPSFPESGGLLPLGGDTNGGYAFWLTEGQPDEWPLVFYGRGFWEDPERHDMPISEFLVAWISGALPYCFGGAGEALKTIPVFRN